MENSIEIPEKFSVEIPYDLAVPLLHIYPKEVKVSQRDICTPINYCSIIPVPSDMKQLMSFKVMKRK